MWPQVHVLQVHAHAAAATTGTAAARAAGPPQSVPPPEYNPAQFRAGAAVLPPASGALSPVLESPDNTASSWHTAPSSVSISSSAELVQPGVCVARQAPNPPGHFTPSPALHMLELQPMRVIQAEDRAALRCDGGTRTVLPLGSGQPDRGAAAGAPISRHPPSASVPPPPIRSQLAAARPLTRDRVAAAHRGAPHSAAADANALTVAGGPPQGPARARRLAQGTRQRTPAFHAFAPGRAPRRALSQVSPVLGTHAGHALLPAATRSDAAAADAGKAAPYTDLRGQLLQPPPPIVETGVHASKLGTHSAGSHLHTSSRQPPGDPGGAAAGGAVCGLIPPAGGAAALSAAAGGAVGGLIPPAGGAAALSGAGSGMGRPWAGSSSSDTAPLPDLPPPPPSAPLATRREYVEYQLDSLAATNADILDGLVLQQGMPTRVVGGAHACKVLC